MTLNPCLTDEELDELNGGIDLVYNRRLQRAEGPNWKVYRVGNTIRIDIEPAASGATR